MAMEVSRGTAYGIGLAQVAVTLGVLLFFPSVDVHLYLVRALVNRTTTATMVEQDVLVAGPGSLEGVRAQVGLPVLLASACAAVFSTVTYRTYESGVAGQDFQQEVLDQIPMWDLLFWLYAALLHVIVVLVIADPVDIFGVVASTCFMAYFLHRACAPKSQTLNLTQENLNIVGYCMGVLMAAYQITDTRSHSAATIMLLVVIDYFLGIGHTYDRQASIDTVANCRLFYICAGTLGTALLYSVCQGPAVAQEGHAGASYAI
jgi:hypothetical protein